MTARVEPLRPQDADALHAFLAADINHNLYLLGVLEEYGVEGFWGLFGEEGLKSALFVGGRGGVVIPSASNPSYIAALAHGVPELKPRSGMGERTAVDAMVRALQMKPWLSSVQRLFAVSADDLGPFTNPALRLAREEDLDAVFPLALGAVREVMKRDPLEEDAERFRARVLHRIRTRRTYVLEAEGALVFKIDVGSRSQHGAELEGLYTLPEHRRLGHATLSLGQISRHLLSSLPRLTLRVNEEDQSLAGVARKVGYVEQRNMRIVIAD